MDKSFAQNALVPMAKLRNLLVHHYADLDAQKLYDVINNHLADVETFLREVKTVVDAPEKFGLRIE